MEEFPPGPPQARPRSVPVVVLDAITRATSAVRRPFRLAGSQLFAIGIGVGIVVIGAMVVSLGIRLPSDPPGTPRRATGDGRPVAGPFGGGGTPSSTGSGSASASGVPTASDVPVPTTTATGGTAPPPVTPGPDRGGQGAPAAPLQARLATVAGSETLTGYRVALTVTNPGGVAATTWTAAVTLPRETLLVTNVDGATATRAGSVWTLAPTAATAQVPAGASVTVTFQVNGATVFDATPTACTINTQPCAS